MSALERFTEQETEILKEAVDICVSAHDHAKKESDEKTALIFFGAVYGLTRVMFINAPLKGSEECAKTYTNLKDAKDKTSGEKETAIIEKALAIILNAWTK